MGIFGQLLDSPQALFRQTLQDWLQKPTQIGLQSRHQSLVITSSCDMLFMALSSAVVWLFTLKHTALGRAFQIAESLVGNHQMTPLDKSQGVCYNTVL
jgi:hypothetical protein